MHKYPVIKNYIFIALFLATSQCLFAQVDIEVTIDSQKVSGSDFFFDLYLKTIASSVSDLYLDNADFVLTYDSANFLNPHLTKVPNPSPPIAAAQNGFCNFISTTWTDPNNLNTQIDVQKRYYDNTQDTIINGELVINLNGPQPGSQTDFNNWVAKIDSAANTYRLGRFKVSGINNPSGNMNLQWKSVSIGLTTKVFSLAPVSPFISTAVNLLTLTNPLNSPLPINLVSFEAKRKSNGISLDWFTLSEENVNFYSVERKQGNSWLTIGQLPALNEPSSPYQFLDSRPEQGINYYRLHIYDKDGNSYLSPIRSAEWNTLFTNNIEFAVFPNPAHEYLQFQFNPQDQGTISFFSIHGQKFFEFDIEDAIEQQYHLNISKIPSGLYMIFLNTSNETKSIKIFKH